MRSTVCVTSTVMKMMTGQEPLTSLVGKISKFI